jgi:serine acetyltransferase
VARARGEGQALKAFLKKLWHVDENIRFRMKLAKSCYRLPAIGRFVGMYMDRTLLWDYGLDVRSDTVEVAYLSISHPSGVLLGGNGIVSRGRVAIMSGVKFVGRHPHDPEYLRRHKERSVFRLGDNVMIGANSVIVGPVDICDNVAIAAMSLVNRSIAEPGLYVGTPVRRVKDEVEDVWVEHLPRPAPAADA